jgi:catechol 2,3-dioxygenase-like lactoylglutathione lyase family enzyme
MTQPRMRMAGVVLGAPDPRALASFYERLLGWTVVQDEGPKPGAPPEDAWVQLRPPSGDPGVALSFQFEEGYVPPVWPSAAGEQQMMEHIDIAVEDLDTAVDWAVQAGANLAGYQPQHDVRVMLDPAGHPFCLFLGQV